MSKPDYPDAVAPTPPVRPRPEDFGLSDTDLTRRTPRDILLSEELASVTMVVGTALAIWRFSWWGILVACAGLGLLYLMRRALDVGWVGKFDEARTAYRDAMAAYDRARNAHDVAMDVWEARAAFDKAEDEASTKSG